MILKAANLAYASEAKASITSRNFPCVTSGVLVLNKVKSTIPLLNGPDVLSSASFSAKNNCLLETFLRTVILMTVVSL